VSHIGGARLRGESTRKSLIAIEVGLREFEGQKLHGKMGLPCHEIWF